MTCKFSRPWRVVDWVFMVMAAEAAAVVVV
jgi:hypothetical protein